MASTACHIVFALSFLFIVNSVASIEIDSWEFTTNECYLNDPIYNHTFDFTTLHSDLAHRVSGSPGDIFEFNICRNLTKACNGQSNVSACMKRGSQEYVLGTSHKLTYRNGRMIFTYDNGSKCKDGTQFQLHVIVSCDYTMDALQLQVTPYSDSSCSFYITLETPTACLPEPESVKSNKCTVKDPSTGYTYNLLSLSDFNYRTSDRNGSIFVINVCKPVLYAEAAMCPPGSSVCLIDLKASDYKKMFINYGTVEANPVVENDQLLIRHSSNTVCNATHNYTSTIYFYCDRVIQNGRPEYMGRKGCTYEFAWINSKACNTVEPCVAFDPVTGFKYNMSSLKTNGYNLKMDDKTYTFGICADAGPPCLEHAGACATINGQSTTLGNSNTNLRFNQTGSPFLLYQSGAICPTKTNEKTSNTTFWTTKIEFVCSSANDEGSAASSTGAAKIIENSNCQLLIHYQTKLACQKQIKCKVRGYKVDDHEMDLTPLISTTDNYEAIISPSISESEVGKSTKFYMNVCRSLVPKYGLGCPGGSAACMAVMGETTPEEEQSLGYPDVSLTRFNETSAVLAYLRGSPCPSDKQTQLSTTIEFSCDIRAGRGTPVLESILSNCHYQFIWLTNVICPPHLCEFKFDTCELVNEQLNERYSVRSASFTDNGKIKLRGSTEYSIDICGEHRKALTDYSQSTVKVFFSAPGPSGSNEPVNVELRLVCSETEESFSSSENDHRNLIYTQRTPEICKFLRLEVPKSSPPAVVDPTSPSNPTSTTSSTVAPTTNNLDPGANKSGSLTTILVVVISALCTVLCLGLLLRTPERRSRVLRIFRRSSSAVRYSRVESNEEANLLLDQNGHFTDSDDDMLL